MEQLLRVLVVDDSVTYRKVVSSVLAGLAGVEVVGTAANGKIALQRIEQLSPDLLLLDVEMPEIGGLELLRRIRAGGSDVGAIMLSAVTANAAKATLQALTLGAFDFVEKPCGGSMEENSIRLRKELRQKIGDFARSRAIRQILRAGKGDRATLPNLADGQQAADRSLPAASPLPGVSPKLERPPFPAAAGRITKPRAVALGISTGGPQSLAQMLPMLPGDLRVPLLIVQHMPPLFTRSLADDLDQRCGLRVCEAGQGQCVLPGGVYIAPGGKQMRVTRENGAVIIDLNDDPPENSCRPSVDYLFRSVAEVYGGDAVGVIMTGMGSDGTRGCRLLKDRGAAIVAQDQASCVVYGMPRGLIEQGMADVVAPLDRIAAEIVRLVGRG
jgi:two-component system chemotaxis response regulator CheB